MKNIFGRRNVPRLLSAAGIILTANLLLLSCGRGGPDGSESSSPGVQSTVQEVPCPGSGTFDVTVASEAFTPQSITVPVYGVVKWTNTEPVDIDYRYWVISDNVPGGTFKITAIMPGESACLLFTAPGEYPYHCDPGVGGTVIVTAATTTAP